MQNQTKLGLSLSNRSVLFDFATIETLIDAAKTAEDSGWFDGVWVGDNFLSKPRVEAMVMLSALAAQTQRVKLGTICLASFPMRQPIPFAIQWASLDILAKGRTILTVCNGGSALDGPQFAHELEVMGIKSPERVGRLIEGIVILRRLWGEEDVTHEGKYYQFANVTLLPKPVQQQVPIWIAFNPKEEAGLDPKIVERGLHRVGKYGDGWQTDGIKTETFTRRFDRIKEYAVKEGRDPSKLESCLHLMVNINESREAAYKEATSYLARYYGVGNITRERTEVWLAYGSPDMVAEKIQSYIDAGCTTPVLRFVSQDLKGQLSRCIEEVIPKLPGIKRHVPATT